MKRTLLFLLLLSAGVFSAAGQIINTERKRQDGAALEEGFTGSATAALSLTRNVADIWSASFIGRLNYRKKAHKALALADTRYLSTNDQNLVNRGYIHLRYTREFTNVVAGEAFSQLQRDPIQRLDLRWLTGAGLRFHALRADSGAAQLHLGATYMREYEEVAPGADETGSIYHRADRLSSYASFAWHISDRANVRHTTYFQPNLADTDDFRLSTETAFNYKMGKHLALGFFFDYFYDSRPPAGLNIRFFTLRNTLSYEF